MQNIEIIRGFKGVRSAILKKKSLKFKNDKGASPAFVWNFGSNLKKKNHKGYMEVQHLTKFGPKIEFLLKLKKSQGVIKSNIFIKLWPKSPSYLPNLGPKLN